MIQRGCWRAVNAPSGRAVAARGAADCIPTSHRRRQPAAAPGSRPSSVRRPMLPPSDSSPSRGEESGREEQGIRSGPRAAPRSAPPTLPSPPSPAPAADAPRPPGLLRLCNSGASERMRERARGPEGAWGRRRRAGSVPVSPVANAAVHAAAAVSTSPAGLAAASTLPGEPSFNPAPLARTSPAPLPLPPPSPR